MQNEHGSGRNNSLGRNHSHHAQGHHHGIKNRDLRLNIHNAKSTVDNSYTSSMRSSDKEKQRQEARAQRERSRANSSSAPEKNEALFSVVQVLPTPCHDRFSISDILGDFAEVSKHHKPLDLIGVDHQPPTPAPAINAHLHDPDYYTPTPTYGGPRNSSDFHSYPPHHSHGVPQVGPCPPKHQAAGPHYKLPNQKYSEELKTPVKNGPGSGINRPLPDRGPPNNIPSSVGATRGRPPRVQERVVDPQVQKIMSEMSDLKSPLSGIIQTPRPDHQSSFTFQTPALPVSSIKDPLSSSGFRHPSEVHNKIGKPSENRSSSSVLPQTKALESNVNDDFQLSEDSEDEMVDVPLKPTNKTQSCLDSGVLTKQPPISPMKNTDESSNSEDSSGSDSESSSSEEEGKHSPAPASPTPSDKNTWSLSTIFKYNNEESINEAGVKGNSDPASEIRPESIPPSPHTVDEPAPPVVTTVPGSRLQSDAMLKASQPLLSPTTTDESSEDELPPVMLKSKKGTGARSSLYKSSKISPSKVKKIVEPMLSESESEDEVPSKSSTRSIKSLPQPISKSPRVNLPSSALSLPNTRHHHQPVARKPLKRKRESTEKIKSSESLNLSDSDSDASIDASVSNRGLSKKNFSVTKPQLPPPSKPNLKIANGDHRNHNTPAFDATTKKTNLPPTISSAAAAVDDRRKISHTGPKYNGEIKPEGLIEKGVKQPVVGETLLKKGKKEKEEDLKGDKKKRKRSRHQIEAEIREEKNHSERIENDIQMMENERVKFSPVTRKTNSNSSNNAKASMPNNNSALQYDNGVPKLICSIPFNLIDKLPSNKLENSDKKQKVNKEVLEMRTSGGKGKGREVCKNVKSPPNEDEKKLRAIYSIYKKRPSSLEPDKIKREVKSDVSESQDVKSPLTLSTKLEDIKLELRPQKEEQKSFKPAVESSVKRCESSPAINAAPSSSESASINSHSHTKKHKKDKRKERVVSSNKDKVLEAEGGKRRRRDASPEPDISHKRSRENSRESVRSSKSSSSVLQHNAKKLKTSHEDESSVLSPRNLRLSSPHPRSSQRNVSEERPSSAMSSEAATAGYQPRPKQGHSASSSQFAPKSSLVISPYLDHECEEDMGIGGGDGVQRGGGGHSFPSSRDKLVEEPHGSTGEHTSEYHSLPSSEHGSSTYRTGEEHASPLSLGVAPPLLDCDQMYPPEINPSPGPSMEYPLPHGQENASNAMPMFFSYFERQIPDILKDNTQYLSTAKELKHLADKERHRVLQTIIYLEAVLYFILTGESMESDPNTYGPSITMYNDTFKLIRHVSSPIYKNLKEVPQNKLYVILTILSLRCQSLLALKLCSMKRNEMKESLRVVCDFLKVNVFQGIGRQPATLPSSTPSASSTCAGGGTPSGGVWGGSQRSAANNSPSSLSPTPSPAGSVGSEGSQSSSGYSTEGTRQRGQPPPMGATPPQETPVLSVPPDVHSMMIKHCHLSYTLNSSHEMWLEADDLVYRHHMKDFFIDLDHTMGPLTLHSTLRELVKYVKTALDKLKKLVNTKL